jgi:tRNA(fMet)-specific endonuclease VapC
MIHYLLDTNIVIYIIKKRPPQLRERFNHDASRIAISSITLAELSHGVEKSAHLARNRAVLDDFVSRIVVLPYADKAAMHYGSVRTALERAGTPIGINDLHIAAHARSEGLALVTNNRKEFDRVPALQVENWLEA